MEQREKSLFWSALSIALTVLLLIIGGVVAAIKPDLPFIMLAFLLLGGILLSFVAITAHLATLTNSSNSLYMLELLVLYIEFIIALAIGKYGINNAVLDIGIHVIIITVSYVVFFLYGLQLINSKCYTSDDDKI
jgi:hypothetical protein